MTFAVSPLERPNKPIVAGPKTNLLLCIKVNCVRRLRNWWIDMAKHHPDLIFCRKQPGVGEYNSRLLPKTAMLLMSEPLTIIRLCLWQTFSCKFWYLFQLLAACAKSAMVNVWSATRMCARAHSFASAMNATMARTRDDAWYAADPVCPMPITAKSAPYKRKTWVVTTTT